MNTLLLVLSLGICSADDTTRPRKPSAIAPSLPALTPEEEARYDDIIDRFILADTGRLKGPEGRRAVAEFEALKSEAIPALIRGINRAAKINHSCPTLMISKKLNRMLMASEDPILLEFARDEIGAGIGRTSHGPALQNLRLACMLRKNALARRPLIPPGGPSVMTTADLVKAVSSVRGPDLQGVLGELGKRDGDDALRGLLVAARSIDKDKQKLGRESLDAHLGRLSVSFLKEKTADNQPEVRKSAIRVAADKDIDLVPSVIDRLTDTDASVRAEAREALRKLSKTEDFGPDPDATRAQQAEAQKRWKAWWFKKTSESR